MQRAFLFFRAKNALFSVKWRYFWRMECRPLSTCSNEIPSALGECANVIEDSWWCVEGVVSDQKRNSDGSFEFTINGIGLSDARELRNSQRVVIRDFDGGGIQSGDLIEIKSMGGVMTVRKVD